jgi:hypothetical protein
MIWWFVAGCCWFLVISKNYVKCANIIRVTKSDAYPDVVKFIKKTDVVLFDEEILQERGFRTASAITRQSTFSGIDPCRDGGECFSGAWLGHMKHLTLHPYMEQFYQHDKSNLLSKTICEDASLWFMHQMFRRYGTNYAWGDMSGQTVDALDFSVLHLSTIDRLLRKVKSLREGSNSVEDIIAKLLRVYRRSELSSIR